MNASLKLLRIETRRSVGLWLFPFAVALVLYTASEVLPKNLWLWPQTSLSVRDALVLAGPLAAGLGAWAAGRNRRRGLEELLVSTPRPAMVRELGNWGAMTAWLGSGYVAAAVALVSTAYLGGLSGPPVVWPIVVGLLAIVASSALGYAVGSYLPSRIIAPLIAVVVYLAQGIAAYNLWGNPASYLSPVAELEYSVFWGILPNVFAEQSLWLIGITGVSLATVTLRIGTSPKAAWVALLAAAIIAGLGAIMLMATPTQVSQEQKRAALVAYQPVCERGEVPVCVHPAYAGALPDAAATVKLVAGPMADLPGGPERAGQGFDDEVALRNGTLTFYLSDSNIGSEDFGAEVAWAVVKESTTSQGGKASPFLDDAQAAVAGWLLQRSKIDVSRLDYLTAPNVDTEATAEARGRFTKLDVKERKSWLRANYAELRVGGLGLEDLP